MRFYETKIEKIERKKETSIQCDFCDKEILNQKREDIHKDMEELFDFEVYDTYQNCPFDYKIEFGMQTSWPEMGKSKKISLDICARCFKKEIMEKAKRFDVKESDW